jgi:hypothetical protein
MKRLVIATVLSVLSSGPLVLAWGDKGHQMTARIAAERLTTAARRGIVTLVRQAPDDDIGLKDFLGHNSGDPQPTKSQIAAALAKWRRGRTAWGTFPTGRASRNG